MMTEQDIQARLAQIADYVHDEFGRGRIMQRMLYEDVLQAIATGTCISPVVCATMALTSMKMDFESL